MKYVLAGTAIFGVLAASCNPTAAPPDGDEVRAEIALGWSEYVEAAKAKDPAALVKIWAPDMRLLSDPGGFEDVRSAEEHSNLAATAFETLTVTSLTHDADEVIVISNFAAL